VLEMIRQGWRQLTASIPSKQSRSDYWSAQ
jgi:hypothetical protein